jgi:hypothetical protein
LRLHAHGSRFRGNGRKKYWDRETFDIGTYPTDPNAL